MLQGKVSFWKHGHPKTSIVNLRQESCVLSSSAQSLQAQLSIVLCGSVEVCLRMQRCCRASAAAYRLLPMLAASRAHLALGSACRPAGMLRGERRICQA